MWGKNPSASKDVYEGGKKCEGEQRRDETEVFENKIKVCVGKKVNEEEMCVRGRKM